MHQADLGGSNSVNDGLHPGDDFTDEVLRNGQGSQWILGGRDSGTRFDHVTARVPLVPAVGVS